MYRNILVERKEKDTAATCNFCFTFHSYSTTFLRLGVVCSIADGDDGGGDDGSMVFRGVVKQVVMEMVVLIMVMVIMLLMLLMLILVWCCLLV